METFKIMFGTALNKYNGGGKGLYYPENDLITTGHDYADNTLARARWYAKNWESFGAKPAGDAK